MIKKLNEIDSYMSFILTLNNDSSYNEPMLSTEEQIQDNLIKAVKNKNNVTLGIFDDNIIIGLFVFLIIEEEKYGEMLVGLSKDKKAYDELFAYLKDNYIGYKMDFIYNPKNDLIQAKLKEYNATFDIEQLNMVLTNYKKKNRTHEVVIYDDKYRDAYLSIHDDMNKYWTKDKVLNALDRFRIILAIVDNKVVGYIDITHKYDENEPYDIFVLEEYRNRGIATDMLSLAIELNGDKN